MATLRMLPRVVQVASTLIALAPLSTTMLGCDDDGGETVGPAGPGATTGSSTGGMTSTSTSASTGEGGSGTASGGSAGYPAGPYGNMEGDVMPLLDWEGYMNPMADAVASNQPWVDSGTDAVYASGTSHALIHLAANF